jgi:hypothetical protein
MFLDVTLTEKCHKERYPTSKCTPDHAISQGKPHTPAGRLTPAPAVLPQNHHYGLREITERERERGILLMKEENRNQYSTVLLGQSELHTPAGILSPSICKAASKSACNGATNFIGCCVNGCRIASARACKACTAQQRTAKK